MDFTLPVSKKVVKMNPMRMKEEKILTNKKFIKNNSTIENLLLSCIESSDGEKPTERMILDLVSGDRNYDISLPIRGRNIGFMQSDKPLILLGLRDF